jgi:hypothetical protein
VAVQIPATLDIVVITLMLGCTALCVTCSILTWQVLQRKVARLTPGQPVLRKSYPPKS